ncbi:cysteine desulfurase family protein [Siansivirga zeaxanthinifaciens]|uniref:cysteine desulfurase n=1 Tax=Siansivirga zeaxanthinifaciens CC-SAMT-1 TaxID=1454006 RepID=A0A0C5WM87_9FLAO|nr:cysteine desulfurase family protein [Siansivirga zeaxanthinifaciens]AJR03975.1 cysteine desulfurase [Siansivirga zeaxanthinifaciens CC-SAMT-1]
MQSVYFDNSATTPLREEVVNTMMDVLKQHYGNASSSHSFGRTSKVLLEKSRNAVAKSLNVSAGEIIFTSGGTESNNLILKSAIQDIKINHIISSKIEHHAVLTTVEALQAQYGIKVSFVNLDAHGDVDYNHLEFLLNENSDLKTLVSLMHVNNEIGNILDLKKVSSLCANYQALFHTDAVQSVGHYKIDLQDVKIDFLSASAHKFHGPKGVGFAFIRKNSGLKPLILGGEQERGLRAGTESLHNIVALETALSKAEATLEQESTYIKDLKAYFINEIKKQIPDATFNGQSGNLNTSAYTILNVCLPLKMPGDMLLFQLDLKGIACSRGSACQSGSNKPSHVLAEILSIEALQKPSIRFSFSIFNTHAEADYVVNVLKEFVLNKK